eukprot:35322-Rhodomonas_salina.1
MLPTRRSQYHYRVAVVTFDTRRVTRKGVSGYQEQPEPVPAGAYLLLTSPMRLSEIPGYPGYPGT